MPIPTFADRTEYGENVPLTPNKRLAKLAGLPVEVCDAFVALYATPSSDRGKEGYAITKQLKDKRVLHTLIVYLLASRGREMKAAATAAATMSAMAAAEEDNNQQYNRKNTRFKTWLWKETVASFLRPSRTTLVLLHGPASVLLLYLTARLFAVENFCSQPAELDFGPNYGIVASDGSFRSNRAFSTAARDGGKAAASPFLLRAVCGFLASFLSFPAVGGTLARLSKSKFPNRTNGRAVVLLVTLVCSLSSCYPAYNLLKRLIGANTVASSSYTNQCFEWAMGYLMGLGGGMLLTSLSAWIMMVYMPNRYGVRIPEYIETFEVRRKQKLPRHNHSHQHHPKQDQHFPPESAADDANCDADEQSAEEWKDHDDHPIHVAKTNRTYRCEYAFGKIEEYSVVYEPKTQSSSCTFCNVLLCNICHVDMLGITKTISLVLLLLFLVSTLGSGICLGGTWNSCQMDNDDCINSKNNGVDWNYGLLYIFILLFVLIEAAFLWVVRRRPVRANSP